MRSGYRDDCDQWDLIRWRGAVNSAIHGRRGQAFLREMLEALDALPKKRLISGELQGADGVCAIGSVGRKRGVDMDKLAPEAHTILGITFGIAPALVKEIESINDDDYGCVRETPEARFTRVRAWIVEQLGAQRTT